MDAPKFIYICRNFDLSNGNSRLVWELALRAKATGRNVGIVAHRIGFLPIFEGIEFIRVGQLPKLFGPFRARSFAWLSSRRAREAAAGGLVHGFGDSYRQDILTLGNTDWTYGRRIPGRKPSASAVHIKSVALKNNSATYITVVSEQMRRDVMESFPNLSPERVRVIYPGADIGRFHPSRKPALRDKWHRERGIPKNARWVVFAAGGDFEKRNFKTLVQALERLDADRRASCDWVFLVAGSKEQDLPLPPAVKKRSFFIGRMNDLSELFPACDLMVYPAWHDEFALVCLEAMASGVPVLLSKQTGASEILPHELSRFCVLENPGDPRALTAKIGEWLNGRGDQTRELFRKAAEGYDWERFYGAYAELYAEIGARRGLSWSL
ncbi:MAG: glycosyltransferase family 4 protein [Elusimicrobia bacterium]|nr:glycosyltransferase family 4 protein [Elusimicrobiota bacterium]